MLTKNLHINETTRLSYLFNLVLWDVSWDKGKYTTDPNDASGNFLDIFVFFAYNESFPIMKVWIKKVKYTLQITNGIKTFSK